MRHNSGWSGTATVSDRKVLNGEDTKGCGGLNWVLGMVVGAGRNGREDRKIFFLFIFLYEGSEWGLGGDVWLGRGHTLPGKRQGSESGQHGLLLNLGVFGGDLFSILIFYFVFISYLSFMISCS